jgi:membrane protease YdiL (CAAX protease family)
VAAWWHTAAVIALITLLAIRGAFRAATLRVTAHPDRLGIYERTILFEWLVLGLVLAGVWLHGSSVYTVLGERWRSMRRFFEDIGIALLFLIASILVTSILSSHSRGGDESTQFLLPQGRTEMLLWIALSITAGICEEAVYRGYLQKQLIALTRNVPAGIVLSALAFGSAHLYQGLFKAIPIAVMGAMAGALAHWRRTVRPGMIAHALQDVLGGFIRH